MNNLPPLQTWDQLEDVLRKEVAYCGCDRPGDAIELLRDVLRGAQGWKEGLLAKPMDEDRMNRCRAVMLGRLGYETNPGLAVWFLYWLDHLGFVEHYSTASVCAITEKGQWILESIERLYPPTTQKTDEAPMRQVQE